MLKISVQCAALASLLLLFAGADFIGNKQFQKSRSALGTVFDITVFESTLTKEQLSQAADEAFTLASLLDRKISADSAEGLASKVATAKSGDAIALDEDLFVLLKDAFEVARLSEGAFDITDAPIREVWAKAKERGELPADDELAKAVSQVGIKRLTLDTQNEKLIVSEEGVRIELTPIARAYVMDKMVRFLKERGIKSAVISDGDSIRFLGLSTEGRNWRMGVEHPRQPDEYAAVLELPEGNSITTVGDYLDFMMVNGKRYPMTLDPRTGKKADNNIAGVTVIAKKTSLSYALAAAFFVLGPEKGHELIEKLSAATVMAVCIEESLPGKLSLTVSDGIQPYLKDIRV